MVSWKIQRTTAAASSSIYQLDLSLGIFLVAINGTVGSRLAGFAFHTDRCVLLAAHITKIPLVHNVEERDKLIAVLIVAVHVVGNRHIVVTVHRDTKRHPKGKLLKIILLSGCLFAFNQLPLVVQASYLLGVYQMLENR